VSDDQVYLQAFRGRFYGVLRWEQLDRLWERVRARAGAGWYLYAVGEPPPEAPSSAERVCTFIDEIDALLRREHQESFCGIVYADSLESPRFVKIFDPSNLGVVCGYSEHPPLPGWVLSTLTPVDLPGAIAPPGGRRRWWQRLLTG
jgi:hypothetical protein